MQLRSTLRHDQFCTSVGGGGVTEAGDAGLKKVLVSGVVGLGGGAGGGSGSGAGGVTGCGGWSGGRG